MENINGNCTISDASPCEGCSSRNKLLCKFNNKDLKAFMIIGFPPAVLSLAGLSLTGVLTGNWWMLIIYTVFTFGMLGAVEMFFLCRHCPYYEAKGSTIVCIGNYGSLKLLPYSPNPMNGFERFMMRFFVSTAFFILPMGEMILALQQTGISNIGGFGGLLLILLLNLVFSIRFIRILTKEICTKCINFSCPLNRVPKEIVDDYLLKNDTMRFAWERKGYKIG